MKPAARKTRNNLTNFHPSRRLNQVELMELVDFIQENGLAKRRAELTRSELEPLIQAIRRELAFSFWQCAALSLFVFILGVFITLLIVLLQR